MMRNAAQRLVLFIILAGLQLPSVYALEPGDSVSEERVIPFKNQPLNDTQSIHHILLITLLAAGVAIGSAFIIKKYLYYKGLIHSSNSARIAILDSKRVSQKLTLFLVSIDDQDYLIGQSGDRVMIVQHHAPLKE